MLKPGTYLQDRYEILEQIGVGGMSCVYKAKCHTLNRLVAIKVLKEEFASDQGFVEKFKMEAQAAARLSHPNIVSVYDVVDEGNLHYIVMELIEGITLKQYIMKKGQLETKEAIGISIQVAQGIGAAHTQHIVHRDIKPQNMIISMDGKVKVADFGIARAVSAQTMNAQAVGSVHYISPEQARGELCDERSDIYSFGITMYEMVTGHVPFEGDTPVAVALAHLEDPLPLPSRDNPQVGKALEEIILKCTQKKPERRYGSMGEVVADLRRALLNPEADLYEKPEEEDLGKTRTMSPEEMNRIQEAGRRKLAESQESPQEPENPSQEPEEDDLEEDLEEESFEEEDGQESRGLKALSGLKRKTGRPKPVSRSRSEDVSTQFEQILAVIRIVVAILVAAVVVFVFYKLGDGFLNAGSARDPEMESTQAQAETQVMSITDDQTDVPALLGRTEEEAQALLEEYGLTLAQPVNEDYSDTYEKGQIMSQSPGQGEKSVKGASVTVTVSLGTDTLDLQPLNLTSMTGTAAQALLQSQDLDLDIELRQEASDTVAKDMVIRTEPSDAVKARETIVLYVSTGPAVVPGQVPNLQGKTQEEAQALLEAAGLQLGTISTQYQEGATPGTVIIQSEMADTVLPLDTPVDITLCAEADESASQEDGRYYLGSINETCSLASYIGPASQTSSVRIAIRLKQQVGENQYDYQTLIQPHLVVGAQTIPVSISRIQGHWGVDTGEVEVVDVTRNYVIQSYTISFFPVE